MAVHNRLSDIWPGSDEDHNVQCDWCNAPVDGEDPVEYRSQPHHAECRRERVATKKNVGKAVQNRRGGNTVIDSNND